MTWLKHVTGTTLSAMGWGSSFWLLSRTSSIGFRRRPNCTRANTRASAGPLRSDFRTSSTTVCSLSQSKFWPCCTVVGTRAFGAHERSRSRTRARVTKGRSQSCSTRHLRILFVDFRIAAVLLGPPSGTRSNRRPARSSRSATTCWGWIRHLLMKRRAISSCEMIPSRSGWASSESRSTRSACVWTSFGRRCRHREERRYDTGAGARCPWRMPS